MHGRSRMVMLAVVFALLAGTGCGDNEQAASTGTEPAGTATPAAAATTSATTPTPAGESEGDSVLRDAFDEDNGCGTDEQEVSEWIGREVVKVPGDDPLVGCAFANPDFLKTTSADNGKGTVNVRFMYDRGDVLDTVRGQSEELGEYYGCDPVADDPAIDGAYDVVCDIKKWSTAEIHFVAGDKTWLVSAMVIEPPNPERPSARTLLKALQALSTD